MSGFDTSGDMFDDSNIADDNSLSEGPAWRGVPLQEIKRNSSFENFLPVRPSSNHHVFFKMPLVDGSKPTPYPTVYKDAWDPFHVRMPHSLQSLFPTTDNQLLQRWDLIKESLKKPIKNSKDLETAIFSYNSKTNQKWSFDALHEFFSETLEEEESEFFFSKILPGIIKLALEIETAFKGCIPFLRRGESKSISMSQEQASILLANAFLCTFPRRNSTTQYSKYPTINFMRLFQCGSLQRVQEKLKCFINYFRRVSTNRPDGVITYTRRHVDPNTLPVWSSVDKALPKMYISSEGTIEDEGSGLLEIDFANKFIGGGVLGRGSVQEEIKFLICPELIISRLFTEVLDDTEAVIVTGCERFNSYEGYGDTFSWSGNFIDNISRDKYRRLETAVAAIDAIHYGNPRDQYTRESINRELNKAYAGFSVGGNRGSGIATGNWGCGAFRGDPRLKSLLQLMAAAVAGKSIAYFTFGDPALRDDIHNMWSFLLETSTSVGTLWKVLSSYKDSKIKSDTSLYDHIYAYIRKLRDMPQQLSITKDEEDSPKKDTITTEKSGESHKLENKGNNIDGSSNINKMEDTLIYKCHALTAESSSDLKKQSLEPVPGETCSLTTEEGRKKCLETEAARWKAYRAAINSCTNSSPRTPRKRKISDYFQKVEK